MCQQQFQLQGQLSIEEREYFELFFPIVFGLQDATSNEKTRKEVTAILLEFLCDNGVVHFRG